MSLLAAGILSWECSTMRRWSWKRCRRTRPAPSLGARVNLYNGDISMRPKRLPLEDYSKPPDRIGEIDPPGRVFGPLKVPGDRRGHVPFFHC
jgi:hypothetical protein